MNYEAALDYLFSANHLGVRPGLERMQELLKRLGNPQSNYPLIHIAGTNGKGSVSSYCAHIAAATDRKVGWFTSPYLESFNERIRIIDGRKGLQDFATQFRSPEISEQAFAELMTILRREIEQMQAAGYLMPTVFEMLTAAAFLYYAREEVDLVVLEVGLGGRLDSTNVAAKSLVSVITALGYDHMDRLGNTLPEIAAEKAGIIKPACPVVLYDPRDIAETAAEGDEALRVIQAKCRELQADLTLVSAALLEDQAVGKYEQSFRFQGEDWRIRLRGRYQLMNAMLAIASCRHFASTAEIREGLWRTTWPGRLELMREDPPVLIDGAHNVQGCAALAREIHEHFAGEELIYFCGILADKEHEKMLRLVLAGENKRPFAVYCTEAPVPRTMPAVDLAREIAGILGVSDSCIRALPGQSGQQLEAAGSSALQKPMIYYSPDKETCLMAALAEAEEKSKGLIAFGSLYVIGNIRPLLRRELWGDHILIE